MTATLTNSVQTTTVLPTIPANTGKTTRKRTSASATAVQPTYSLSGTGIVWQGIPSAELLESVRTDVNSRTGQTPFLQADLIVAYVDVQKLSIADAAAKIRVFGEAGDGGKPMSANYAESLYRMASHVPIANRRPELTLTHHVRVWTLKPEQQVKALDWAVQNTAKISDLEKYVRDTYPKPDDGKNRGGRPTNASRVAAAGNTVQQSSDNGLLGSPTRGIQTDTSGQVISQPVVTVATSDRTDRMLVVPTDLADTIKELAKNAGVSCDDLLRSMLAGAITAEQVSARYSSMIAKRPVKDAPTPTVQTPPTDATSPVQTANPPETGTTLAAPKTTRTRRVKPVVIPVTQSSVDDLIGSGIVDAQAVADALGAKIQEVRPFMPAPPTVANRFDGLETGE